jgi:hypothetical protein
VIEFINYEMQDLRLSQQCYWRALLLLDVMLQLLVTGDLPADEG